MPEAFAVTLFHVIYCYPDNITCVSTLSKEIVYNQNFDAQTMLRGLQLDSQRKMLLAY